MILNYSRRDRRSSQLHVLHLFWLILLMPSVSHALECPRLPEQARNDLEVEVRSAVGKIGTAKGAELETRTRNITRDLLGKLPKADKVYLELMMYAAYCSTLRDDASLSESQKSAQIRAYNLELKSILEGVQGSADQRRAGPKDAARAELERIPLPYTTDAFIKSAKQGNLTAIKLFLAAGMDPNGINEYGNSALISAAEGGHIEIVKALLKAKASVNHKSRNHNTAVSKAVVQGYNDILRLLLDHGANADILEFPFKFAAEKGNVEAVRMMFKHGVDNRTRDEALIETAGGDASEAHVNEVVRFLLAQGADVNAKKSGCTALAMAAARTERATIVRTLLDAGADINSKSTCTIHLRTRKGWTPLMFALSDVDSPHRMAVVNLLLARGADPNLASEDGVTSLMVAAEFKDINMMRNLLDRGMDPNRADNKGETALMNAAGSEDNIEAVRLLLDRGADPNLADKSGKTALISASISINNVDTIRLLLEKGANPNAKDKNSWWAEDEFTALMWAILLRRTENMEALLDAGVDLHIKSKKGTTALVLAVREGRIEVVQALLRRGVKANDEDAIGKTVLNYAEDHLEGQMQTDMIRILKKAGAK